MLRNNSKQLRAGIDGQCVFQPLALPTRWRRKPAGIDMEPNCVIVILCILCNARSVDSRVLTRYGVRRHALFARALSSAARRIHASSLLRICVTFRSKNVSHAYIFITYSASKAIVDRRLRPRPGAAPSESLWVCTGWSYVTGSCGHDTITILWVWNAAASGDEGGEDLSRYSTKIQPVCLRKCPYQPINKGYLTDITVANISRPTRWRRKPAGIDMERNYVTVMLYIRHSCIVFALPIMGRHDIIHETGST